MEIKNELAYLTSMSKPIKEKLKISRFIPDGAKKVLDVGCADGVVTNSLAQMFPMINFLGIDLKDSFIDLAKANSKHLANVSFERNYLRDILPRNQKFDCITFCSVLHEFYTYGEGISSVLKAIADAHELLVPGGYIIIRDMVLPRYTKHADLDNSYVVAKIMAKKEYEPQVNDFEQIFGKLNNHHAINHFLLKYWYTDNWDREVAENYVSVTFEDYEHIFDLLGMKLQYKESYLINYIKNKWVTDFGFTEDELSLYRSTGFLVAKKV